MPTSLSRIQRWCKRVAVFGLVYLAFVAVASAAREPRTGERGTEETVHAAQDYAAALRVVAPGAGGDDDDTAHAIACAVCRPVELPPASASGVRALRTDTPTSPTRFLPAARGPPTRA